MNTAALDWGTKLPRLSRIRTSATVFVLLMASAQIALPLIDEPVVLSSVVILALAAATCSFAVETWRTAQIFLVTTLVLVASMAVEMIGIRSGVPFGRYEYTDALRPQILGVPALVGLAWAAMLLPAWELARRITPHRTLQTLVTGIALVVWDLFLDPQMIQNNFWFFSSTSGWQGVPITNAIGWFITGSLLAWIPALLLERNVINNGLAFLYTWMIGFSALGYVIPFALNNPQIGIVGALCAAPLVYLAFGKRDRIWLTSQ